MIGGIEDRHKQQIHDAINDIYGSTNIEAAFITGSVAAAKARPDSDVDIFVCHGDAIDSPEDKKQKFTDFYFDLHAQLGREPDPISPGEVLSLSGLTLATRRIQNVMPSTVLYERDDFDAICWAGMLVSKRDILMPYSEHMESLRKISRLVVYKWASALTVGESLTEEAGEYSDVDKVLRRTISSPGYYDAH
ncbi:MAG: hypothetical protein JWO99_251 [Candidatus Saccharibacteria bacterium]|nr:hypothetical protein [Candidatus Saccharibacteria bacterium]